jgi:hypothetical protein
MLTTARSDAALRRSSCSASRTRLAAAIPSHRHPQQAGQHRLRTAALSRATRPQTQRGGGTVVLAADGDTASIAAGEADESNLAAVAAAAEEAAPDALPFDWLRAWYAVGMTDALVTDGPTALRVLGVPLALWRDGGGAWRAVRDACPHRLAPLSEGRIAEDGTLQARAQAGFALIAITAS